MSDFFVMRQNMVKRQVILENVTNPLLIDALFTIPREKFVPSQLARIAYMDTDFFLNKGRFLLRPATLARLLEALNLKSSDKILYIAGGTGYGPALLSQMAHHIIALDSEETLTQTTERLAQELHLSSIESVLGPLEEGWENGAPYDKIFIEGCVDFIPRTLAAQLKEGGQFITIKSLEEKKRIAVKIDKKQGVFTENFLFDAFAPRLKSFQAQKSFIF
jgi:protein-L-isoaspartate(D-aspartate) O-methyltransferase